MSIPTEIINEILLRLPVKTLCRFCSVSKLWCALIKDPYFIKNHLQRSITTKSNRSLYLDTDGGTLFSLNLREFQTPIKLEIPKETFSERAYVMGCCNGVVLLKVILNPKMLHDPETQQFRSDLVLFNPTTGQYRILPRPQKEYHDFQGSFFEQHGFGYDSANDDYKVIKVLFNQFRSRVITVESKIFSLKSNSWRNIEKLPVCLAIKRLWGVHLNGRLYSVTKTSNYSVFPDIIVAFDLRTENCHFIPLPDLQISYVDNEMESSYVDNEVEGYVDNVMEGYVNIAVEVFEGCLCVVAMYDDCTTDILMYGANEVWSKLFTIGAHLVEHCRGVCPLVFSKNGREVLLNIDDENLIWYDPERGSVRMLEAPFCFRPNRFYVEVGVESLVLLDH